MKILLTLFTLVTINIYAQIEPRISSSIYFDDGRNNVRTLRFGVDPLATDGVDIIFGESLVPPFPPFGVIEAQFFLPYRGFSGEEAVYWDFRQGSDPMTGTREHRIKYQKGEGDTVNISWNFPPSIRALLQDLITGTFINIQLSGSGSYRIPNPGAISTLKLMVQYDNTTDTEPLPLGPAKFELGQNYPNPFNPSTTIRFALESRELVSIKVYDVSGREVSTVVNEEMAAGHHEVIFNAANLSSGIYFYSISAGEFRDTRSMMLMK